MTEGPFSGVVRHVYVHVPFCRERCDYCDFASTAVGAPDGRAEEASGSGAARERLLDRYVEAVAVEWERERAARDVGRLETLYVGGGTPSLLGTRRLERLLQPFRRFLTPAAEVTVEVNPEDVDDGFARWAASGLPAGGEGSDATAARPAGARAGTPSGGQTRSLRISLGVQSFDPGLRAALGRRAAADPAVAARRLRAAGVSDLSIDLMHGIPGQTAAMLGDDVATVLDLRPGHVSWYELDLVEGTALAARLEGSSPTTGRTAVTGPDEDERAVTYRRIVRELTGAGYAWYEVSNFALPGRRARHNVAYWRACPYLGLGAGAVSTVGRRRWTDLPDAAAYVDALLSGAPPPREVEELSAVDLARERLMLAARCGLRVPLGEVAAALAPEALPPLAAAGMISLHGGTIAVTRKGRYLANEVSVRLYRV